MFILNNISKVNVKKKKNIRKDFPAKYVCTTSLEIPVSNMIQQALLG